MKLSEAILLGSTLSGQSFQMLIDRDGNTCANGAALLAMGVPADCLIIYSKVSPWDHPNAQSVRKMLGGEAKHPISGKRRGLASIIVDLNNNHRWTREQIAEWVAKIEPQESPEPESAAEIRKSQGISDFALNQHVSGGNWNG